MDLEKTEEPEINSQHLLDHRKKFSSFFFYFLFQKNIYFCFIDYAKAFDCLDHNKLWEILRDENTIPYSSWEICMQVKK